MMRCMRWVVVGLLVLAVCGRASGQNPIQWSGDARGSIARARELSLPLMFWIADRPDTLDDDDLYDMQDESFRDAEVVALATQRFVPVRVTRNSRVKEVMQELGLPADFGRYIAIVTPDGRVLDRIEAGQVAEPAVLAQRLRATFARYCDELYQKDLRGKIRDLTAPKNDVRRAVQLVWRLGIASADRDVVGLLARKDLTPVEKSRLYALLAALGTQPCVEALLSAAATKDQEAARALSRAEAKALEFLLKELPEGAGAMSDRAIAAYTATVHIARAGTAKPEAFWKSAKPEEQAKELERVRTRAEPVLQYWKERQSAGG